MLNVPHVPKKLPMQPCNLYVMKPIKLSFLSHPAWAELLLKEWKR